MSILIRLLFSLILFTSLSTNNFAQDNTPLVRYPAINNDGSVIAFSYQGDIWTLDINKSRPIRLTAHKAHETTPRFSPDGKHIAFISNRFGNNDIYMMPAQGGTPARLTYLSTNDNITNWTHDGRILFETFRTYNQIEWDGELYQVSVEGGTPDRLLDAFGSMAAVSPDGRFIAYVHGNCRIAREDYKGPANRQIWIYDTKNKTYNQLTDFEGQDIYPRWADMNTIYFLSTQSGRYNVHKMNITEDGKMQGEPKQITNYTDDGIRYFDISSDGSKIVFERQSDIYTLETQKGKAEKVEFAHGTDYKMDPYEHKTFTSDATEYAVSPNGKLSALVIRGEVFVTLNDKEKSRAVNLSNHPFRDRDVVWLSDSTLIFSSDREGQYDLYMVKSSDTKETNIFKSLKHETVRITDTEVDETTPVVSPDGKKIVYRKGTGGLVVADISPDGKLSGEKTLRDGWAGISDATWSPDSKWLAYSMNDLNFNDDIYIHAADNSSKPVNVTMHPKSDSSPFWSPDGSKLGFISNRSNMNTDIWFVWLKKEDWEKTKLDWDDVEEKKDTTSTKETEIDFKDIHERLSQVTSLPGNESDLAISKDGKTFYFVSNRAYVGPYKADIDLHKIKWDGSEMKAITKGSTKPSAVSIDKEGKFLYFFKPKGKYYRVDVSKDKEEGISYKGKATIEFAKEREQIFEEAWRTLNDGFYDPEFHGNDWDALRDKYKPWCMAASTYEDFKEIFNYMLGQLNASHMGLYGNGPVETQKETTGLLGIDISPVKNGVVVNRVIPKTPADKKTSKLYTGDVITSVGGKQVNQKDNFYSFFTNTANEKVLLNVTDKNGNEREVVIRPVNRITDQLYDEWVKERRKLTDKYSGGRLGYLHIEQMGWESFERFERELSVAGYGKEGIVIDVRYNGGGWTTDYLMAILNVKQHAYTVPRGAAEDLEKEHRNFRENYPYTPRLPFVPWTKASITMCNENSYSNAEIFSHAYKTLGIGKLVGVPTFTAVISTGGKGMINNWWVRQPFRAWYVKATDENMETNPAMPDIVVQNSPDYKIKGVDEQLKKSVDVLLKQIDNN